MPSRRLAVLAAAGLVAGGLVAGVGASPAHAASSSASYFVNAINAQRVAHGRARLAVSGDMSAAAQRWAAAMARSNKLYHNPRLASSVSNWRVLGENVGVGPSASSLEAAFYASPEHRANMLDREFTEIGVGIVVVNGKMWVAEEFRRPMYGAHSSVAKPTTTKHKATHKSTHKATHKTLAVGSRGSLVRVVQRLLHITADGIYGPQTKSAVANFQQHHHLKATGRVDAKTLAILKR
ncbi:MAG: CAP domain-containing protein [Actinomycetales bacterium]